MRICNMLKLFLLIIFSNILYAQDFYIYNLFDNKFQAVFPGQPSMQNISKEQIDPKEIEQALPNEYKKQLTQAQIKQFVSDTIRMIQNNQPLIYVDTNQNIAYIAQSVPSQISENSYKFSGIKNQIDELLKQGLKADGRAIQSFTSTYDKKNQYIAMYTTSYILDGQTIYTSTKHIFYKDKVFKWSIQYFNKASKEIFDMYQHDVKLIN